VPRWVAAGFWFFDTWVKDKTALHPFAALPTPYLAAALEEAASSRYPDHLTTPSINGNFSCMKKTLQIDDQLLAAAKGACRASTDTETIRLGLEALVRRGAQERLRALRGSEPGAKHAPRRREKVARKRGVKRRAA
jgi:Arc/MetJ family transcription regulator